jgi:hypothetical protein
MTTKKTDKLPAPAVGAVAIPDGLSEDRRLAFEQMNDALRAKTLAIQQRLDTEWGTVLESRYATGRDMLEIKNRPDVYGPMSDLQMAAYFGSVYGETVLNEARRLAERYPPETFQKIVQACNPETSYRVGLKVLTTLLRIEDDAVADQVLGLAIAGSWSSRELALHINEMNRPAPPERRRPRPATFPGFVENISAVCREWQRQCEEVWQGGQALIDSYAALPANKITPEAVAKVTEAETITRQVAQSAAALARELRACCRRAEAALRPAQGEGPPAADRAGGEGETGGGENDGE